MSKIDRYIWASCSFPVTFVYRRVNFWYSLQTFFLFIHNLTQLLQQIEIIYHHLQQDCYFVSFYPIREICMINNVSDLSYEICKEQFDVYDPIWYLGRIQKNSLITSSAVTLSMHYIIFICGFRGNKINCYF